MITVLSTEPYDVAENVKKAATCVILPRTEQSVVLGEDLGDAVFHKSIDFEEVPRRERIIFVNAPAEESVLRPEIKKLGCFEYWVDIQNVADLLECLRNGQSLTVLGINAHDNWLKLLIQPGEKNGRPASDLLRGIELAVYATQGRTDPVAPASAQPPHIEPGFGSLLINFITPYAKPFKQYLPKSMVAALYKLLEKIR
ncbi:hypothetical protein [Corynebacterium sp. NML120713]|uniref:hypothetical protein n=1 Tax=Corynebacterium sp. NML120713 TaxID=1906332 RepID=UPI0008FB4157|nr:hypothetical protein [Corynebacterium sp. NML120713]OIR42921.1 hypothetical protein BJP06_07935 [Corynebacterium sp. NML120713]